MTAMKKMMEDTSAEDRKKSMSEWGVWMGKNKMAFADSGAPVGKNSQVTASGASEVSNDVGGYSIMQGESKEAVEAILAQSPHVQMPGTVTDVREIMAMPGI